MEKRVEGRKEERMRKERREGEGTEEGSGRGKGRGKVLGLIGKFLGNCLTLFQSGCTFFCFYQQCMRDAGFFASSPAFSTISILYFTHSDRCVVIAYFHFPKGKQC